MRIGPLCVLACRWSASVNFWLWANVKNADAAKQFMLQKCGVKTRKDLDGNPEAAKLFHQQIRVPYMFFLHEHAQGVDLDAKAEAAVKLLKHGALSELSFINTTGWPHRVCELVLARLRLEGRVMYLGADNDLYGLC